MTDHTPHTKQYLSSFSVQQGRHDGATHAYSVDLRRSPPPSRLLLPLPGRQQRIQRVVHPRKAVSPVARANVGRRRQQAFRVDRSTVETGGGGGANEKKLHITCAHAQEKEVDTQRTKHGRFFTRDWLSYHERARKASIDWDTLLLEMRYILSDSMQGPRGTHPCTPSCYKVRA